MIAALGLGITVYGGLRVAQATTWMEVAIGAIVAVIGLALIGLERDR